MAGPDGPMKIFSDIHLVRRYRSGEKEAFDEIFRRYQDEVYTYFARQFRADVADELTQEAMFRLLKELDSPKAEAHESLRPLMMKIRHGVAVDWLRREPRRKEKEAEAAPPPDAAAPASDARVAAAELATDVGRAFESLSPRRRAVAALVLFHDYTYDEVATRLGLPTIVVRDLFRRARAVLRLRLADYRKGWNHDRRTGRFVFRSAGTAAAEGAAASGRKSVGTTAGGSPPEADAAQGALLRARNGGGDSGVCDRLEAVASGDAAGGPADRAGDREQGARFCTGCELAERRACRVLASARDRA